MRWTLMMVLWTGCSSSALRYEPAGGILDLSEGGGTANVDETTVWARFEYLDDDWRVFVGARVDKDGYDGDISDVDSWIWWTIALADNALVDFKCDESTPEAPVTGRLSVQPRSDGNYSVGLSWDKVEGGCGAPKAVLRLSFRTVEGF